MSSLVLRAGPYSVMVERRTVLVSLALVGAGLALALAGLCRGASWATPSEVLSALAGQGDSVVVIRDWRLPRVAAALVFGASLGLAGAVFQNLTRNALGSPDVIGLDAGAYTGALVAITVLSGTAAQLAIGSVAGGLLAALAIYVLSLKSGLSGLRLIVIGIAMNAILTAVNSWIELRAELEVAIAATGWSAGSLNGVDWDEVRLPFLIIGGLMLVLVTLSHAMHQSALGDELAITSGVGLNRLRLLLVLVGVGCTATVTAIAGPIVFIALAAPQIGRRLTGAAGVPLVPAALTGAVLLLAADLVAQLLLAPMALPVGVVTTAIGGCYLIWLLFREVKRP
ncbi:FecCD family ABC transporter permease [Nonomuraea cavernae]|uniref:Iron-enterobactin transporter permease n=1 Tax=Nonomuraea cavernae TaxID=2045107 RepID=A0A917YVK2_9ACTN|nr:iron chelate uptake ABC transporter family permease subunit [Nonomuraea cavernae]MCA2187273.1 iron chelate uptake ABC transporter family permease subunit [Nonomuraea cavernae]GGO68110.1 iron-enterobactin transporter permease [Nonomuraea cavernae]